MQVYDLAHYGLRGMIWFLAAMQLLVATLLVIAVRVPTFEVSGEGLRIGNSLFGRAIPAQTLRLDEARVVDLRAIPDLAPRWRSFGIGLPGYRAGWFRLSDGEKALVFLGRGGEALYIPTSEGYALLIAPNDPEGCLRALKGGRA